MISSAAPAVGAINRAAPIVSGLATGIKAAKVGDAGQAARNGAAGRSAVFNAASSSSTAALNRRPHVAKGPLDRLQALLRTTGKDEKVFEIVQACLNLPSRENRDNKEEAWGRRMRANSSPR